MKIFTPDEASWKEVVQMTKTEFDLLRDKNIPQIVKYIEFNPDAIWTKSKGQQVRCCFLVMEYLKAAEVLEFINEAGVQDERFIRHIFSEIAGAIH